MRHRGHGRNSEPQSKQPASKSDSVLAACHRRSVCRRLLRFTLSSAGGPPARIPGRWLRGRRCRSGTA
jgi:hypothetical protein